MTLVPLNPGFSALVIGSDTRDEAISSAGFQLHFEAELTLALRDLTGHDVQLVVLRGAPRGWTEHEACVALRKATSLPLLVVSNEAESSRLALFEAGADDTVPVSATPREVALRAAALVRRALRVMPRRTLERGALFLDSGAQRASFSGHPLPLTGYEFSILRVLAEDAGQAVSREALMERAKGSGDESFERSIDVHVCRLRAKLGRVDGGSRVLKTVRGVGYMLELQTDTGARAAS